MISDTAGVTELVRYIAWGYESFTSPQCEDLLSDGSFQFAGKHKQCFILARMCMSRHAFSRRDSQIEEAICSSRIFAREKDRTESDVEVITLRFRLILNGGSHFSDHLNVIHS